jgi:hypothetical protein
VPTVSDNALNQFQIEMKARAKEILKENSIVGEIVFCAPIGSNAIRGGSSSQF